MKIKSVIFAVAALLFITACSKSDEEEETKPPLVNHSNTGNMEKQLKGNVFQGYGKALDKGHNVGDTLQQGADRTKAQEEQQ